MNQIIRKKHDFSKDFPYENMPLFELINEMEQMGISTTPYLELAAKDILDRLGADAFAYSEAINHKMKLEKNSEGIYLWNRLHEILSRFAMAPSHTMQ